MGEVRTSSSSMRDGMAMDMDRTATWFSSGLSPASILVESERADEEPEVEDTWSMQIPAQDPKLEQADLRSAGEDSVSEWSVASEMEPGMASIRASFAESGYLENHRLSVTSLIPHE